MSTSPERTLLRDVYLSISSRLMAIPNDSLEAAFATWIYPSEPSIHSLSPPTNFSVTSYTDVAQLSFIVESDPALFPSKAERLIDGLQRVAGRSTTLPDAGPAPFQYDAVALIGLALAAKRIGGDVEGKVRSWMQSFINIRNYSIPSWKRLLFFAAFGYVGASVDERDIQDIVGHDDLKLAIATRGGAFFTSINTDEAYRSILRTGLDDNVELSVLACKLQALHYLVNIAPIISINKPTIDQVLSLLANVPAGLKRWPWESKPKTRSSTTQKWDLQNEYHVQSLIYALLAPIFSDIESEFYLEPAGQINPRADLGIPSLGIIIEIKFLRPSGTFGKIIEEVASDASLYFQKDSVFTKKYSSMVVFLWDDSARNQEHREFQKGLTRIEKISGSVAISRPGNMPIQRNSDKTK